MRQVVQSLRDQLKEIGSSVSAMRETSMKAFVGGLTQWDARLEVVEAARDISRRAVEAAAKTEECLGEVATAAAETVKEAERAGEQVRKSTGFSEITIVTFMYKLANYTTFLNVSTVALLSHATRLYLPRRWSRYA